MPNQNRLRQLIFAGCACLQLSGYYTTVSRTIYPLLSSFRFPLSPGVGYRVSGIWYLAAIAVIVNTQSVIRRRLRKPKEDKQQLTSRAAAAFSCQLFWVVVGGSGYGSAAAANATSVWYLYLF